MSERAVITIATGKKIYVDMVVNLARSFILWNKDNGIDFYVATDLPQYLTDDVKKYAKIILLKPDELGKGFSTKLHLDKLAPVKQTLFIDSDCLVYGNLISIFEKFSGHNVSVVGNYINTGEWFGDIAAICKKFNIKHLPKFNGGVYYLESGVKSTVIYETARTLETQYDDIGFVRLRGRPNDEVIMALAMELNKETPVADDGKILAEFINFQSGITSDVLNGKVELYNNPNHNNYQQNWHLTIAKPVIVHYLGHHNQVMPYIKEVKLLQYIFENRWPKHIARLVTFVKVSLPFILVTLFKNIFRPLYRILGGTRKIKKSERIID